LVEDVQFVQYYPTALCEQDMISTSQYIIINTFDVFDLAVVFERF